MSRIVTITFNPAIDKTTAIGALAPEKKLRCGAPHFEPGGGGINVARAVTKLGGAATALFPAGGHTGKFICELMEGEGVPYKAIPIQGYTRENLIVYESSTGQQYRFGMPGPKVAEEEWKAILEAAEKEEAEYFIASGSLAPGMPTDILAHLAAIARRKGAKLVVDTSGEALKKAVEEGVFLLKPNLGELSSLAGLPHLDEDRVAGVARDLIGRGCCQGVMVSMGAAGALLVWGDQVIQAVPPVVKRLSTVGAGDSMVAGAVLSLSKGAPLEEALRYGVAAGTAATMNPGTELCRKEDVDWVFKKVRLQALPGGRS